MRSCVFLPALFVLAVLSCGGNESAKQTRTVPGSPIAYSIKCGYLAQPETVFPLVKKTAEFWKKAYDPESGGFFTFVANDGTTVVDNTVKTVLSQSRDAFCFSRAWMLTGDESYLDYGNRAIEFLARSGWDETNGGFFTCLSQGGEPVDFNVSYDHTREKWSFMQHYALLGIAAMYDGDREIGNLDFLTTARKVLDTKLWDSRPGMEGYFETADYN